MKPIYIKSCAAYAPGLESKEDWLAWSRGEKLISPESSTPKLSFVPMLTRRRLSALSKMVVLVNHQISFDKNGNSLPAAKITFASEFGEIAQQLKISQTFLEMGTVSPAHFSLSVFNTSVANATILEKNTFGYSAVFSGKKAFSLGLKDCISTLQAGSETERIFIFADELIPEIYGSIAGVSYPNKPCALAIHISTSSENAIGILKSNFDTSNFETASDEALAFIKKNLLECL